LWANTQTLSTTQPTEIGEKKMLKLLTLLLLIPAFVQAGINNKNFGSITVPAANITSIYDADTFRINIPQWPSIIGERIGIRVNGVDAPELRSRCKNKEAKQREKTLAREAKQFAVAMLRSGKTIELRNLKRGKYFRIVADVYVDGVSLADRLIKAGHGRFYHGKTKVSWCNL
jgi:micrococcal nuclease